MEYLDRVYGEIEITEPVVLEIIESPAFQRLKKIDQAGYRPLWVKPESEVGEAHTRLAHSIGVYLLLQKYKASIDEQIAGLIHDISHCAFSHAGDYIFDEGSQKEHNHQDNIFDSFIRKTSIPEILEKYGFDLARILNDNNFSLKENKLPDLCADRIDYSLRTAILFGEITDEEMKDMLDNLEAEDNKWIFKNFVVAKKYADMFFKLNKLYYSDFSSAVMFQVTADCLRYAFQGNYISVDDLYTTDEMVLEKIKNFAGKDNQLKLFWERMNDKNKCENNAENYDVSVFCKSRVVDPLCRYEGEIKRVSDVSPNWKGVVEEELKPKEYFIKFID